MQTRQDDGRAARGARWLRLITALALGLTLAGCDHCGDYFWQRPGACKTLPPG
jgi:hypothetical protein